MYGFAAMEYQEYRHEPQQKAPPSVFVATAVLLFFASLSAADSIGFVPYYVDGSSPREVALADLPELGELFAFADTETEANSSLPEIEAVPVEVPVAIKPERIRAGSIGLDLVVQNPETRDIHALDELLKNGPARFVDSALLGQKGNVLIFAHSSRLPVVHNAMYKAFNRVPELKAGETITLVGEGREFLYSVTSVRRADAEEEIISLAPEGKKLTLVTCDNLTSKSSRFIVEAELVGEI